LHLFNIALYSKGFARQSAAGGSGPSKAGFRFFLRQAESWSRQRFCKQPEPEHGLAGLIQHLQSPFGIFPQAAHNVPGEIGAYVERGLL
jgi:hypothetical protein